jgi:hypothetical protein
MCTYCGWFGSAHHDTLEQQSHESPPHSSPYYFDEDETDAAPPTRARLIFTRMKPPLVFVLF